MTITQTVEIPANHRLTIDVPREVPTGTRIIIQFPVKGDAPTGGNGKIRITKAMIAEMQKDETLLSLTGILHTDMTIEEIRNERLAKHLK